MPNFMGWRTVRGLFLLTDARLIRSYTLSAMAKYMLNPIQKIF
jgi:hypothetical protein